jgi:hypothetical protein
MSFFFANFVTLFVFFFQAFFVSQSKCIHYFNITLYIHTIKRRSTGKCIQIQYFLIIKRIDNLRALLVRSHNEPSRINARTGNKYANMQQANACNEWAIVIIQNRMFVNMSNNV